MTPTLPSVHDMPVAQEFAGDECPEFAGASRGLSQGVQQFLQACGLALFIVALAFKR